MRAIWQYTVIAQSDKTIIVEGEHYFPPESVKKEYLRESDYNTFCQWKGAASYYDIVVGEDSRKDAAWYYPEPKPSFGEIKGYIAFNRNKGVSIMDDASLPG